MSARVVLPDFLDEPAPRDAERVRTFVSQSRSGLYRNTVLMFVGLIAVTGLLLRSNAQHGREASQGAIVFTLGMMTTILGAILIGVAWRTRAVVIEVLRIGQVHTARIVSRTTGPRGLASAHLEIRRANGGVARGVIDLPIGAPGQLSVGTESNVVVAGRSLAFLAPADGRAPIAYPGRLTR